MRKKFNHIFYTIYNQENSNIFLNLKACIFNIKKAMNILKSKTEMKFKFMPDDDIIYNA